MAAILASAAAADLPSILDLLRRSALPEDGLAEHLGSALVVREGGRLVGCAALEIHGGAALLRSVAVDPARRGEGLGVRLTEAALELARRRGIRQVFLLTTTAGGFFPRFGFRPIGREQVPEAVRGSIEFVSACPASALAFGLDLGPEAPPVRPR